MSLVRWSPSLMSPFSRWPNIWDEDDFAGLAESTNNLDVYETDSEVIVRANVAGVPAERVEATYEKGVLWIQATAQEESPDSEKKHYSKSSWNYSYKVAVPGDIDQQAEPNAEIEDGIITVTFKKTEASKPKKLNISHKKKLTK